MMEGNTTFLLLPGFCRRPCHLIVSAPQFKKSVALVTKPMIEACYKKGRHCVVAGPRQTDKLCSTLLKLKVLFTYTQLQN